MILSTPAERRDTPEAEAHVVRTARLFESAGRHFNRSQRAFFFALGFLGWSSVRDHRGRGGRDPAKTVRVQRVGRDGAGGGG